MENERDIVEVEKPNGRVVMVLRRDVSVYTAKGFKVRCGTPSSEEAAKPKPVVGKKVEAKKVEAKKSAEDS